MSDENRSLKKYLEEIGEIELLPPEEELALVQIINSSDNEEKIDDVKEKTRMLTDEQLRARDTLVKGNLKFVASVAKSYQGQGLSLQDLINEGNLGLIIAATKFDETRGFKFISYAVWWIRQKILLALEETRVVCIPDNRMRELKKVNKTEGSFQQEQGEGNITEEAITKRTGLSRKAVQLAQINSQKPVSFDAPFPKGHDQKSDENLLDCTASSNTSIDFFILEDSIKDVFERKNLLNDQEELVIRFRFGIGVNDGESKTLEAIGAMMRVTRSRVSQIEKKAIKKLKNSKELRECYFE